jgi:hypothetical protein
VALTPIDYIRRDGVMAVKATLLLVNPTQSSRHEKAKEKSLDLARPARLPIPVMLTIGCGGRAIVHGLYISGIWIVTLSSTRSQKKDPDEL